MSEAAQKYKDAVDYFLKAQRKFPSLNVVVSKVDGSFTISARRNLQSMPLES